MGVPASVAGVLAATEIDNKGRGELAKVGHRASDDDPNIVILNQIPGCSRVSRYKRHTKIG